MYKKIIKFIQSNKIILLIMGLGFILRIHDFSSLFYYTMDEEVMNLIQRSIVFGQHFPLIGSVSPLNTYLGPIFYYFGAMILAFSNINPIGQGIFGVLLGTINIFLIYKISTLLFNKKVGILAALFYSSSFLAVLFDRRYWHLTPGPFLSLLVLLSIYKIKQRSIKYVYLLVGALIFGWNTDYTNLVLFLFVGLVWILYKLPIKRKEVLIAVLIFLISNLPLAVFDIRHDFLNAKSFVNYFTKAKQEKHLGDRESLGQSRLEQTFLTSALPLITYSRTLYINSDLNISNQHTYCKAYIKDRNNAQGVVLPILASLLILAFGYLTFKNWKAKDSFSYKIIFSFYLIFQMGVLFYSFVLKGDVFEHYLATLLPYLFIITAVVFNHLENKIRWPVLAVVTVVVIINIIINFNAYNPYGFEYKIQATKFALEQIGDKDFSLDSLGSCFRYDGVYYPFLLFGKHPVKSFQDPNYSWLYDYKIAENHPENIVVMVQRGKIENPDFNDTYNRYQQWVKARKTFRGIEVLILDNKKGDFY